MKTYKKPFSRVIKFNPKSFCEPLGTSKEEHSGNGYEEMSKGQGGSSMWENMDED